MNGIRCWQKLLLAAMLAALAVPALAATKQFSISVGTVSTTTTLTFTNGSQGGNASNSTVNSVKFVPPYAVSNVKLQANLVTSNTTIAPASCATAAGCAAGTTISITYITGFAPGNSASITMTGGVPLDAASCTAQFNWTAQAFTGNALGGTNFLAPDGSVTAKASQAVTCSLEFLKQPANAEAGANITSVAGQPDGAPVQVRAIVNGLVATSFAGPVTLTPSSGSLTGGGPVNAVAGVATFGHPGTTLALAAPGVYTLKASAAGFSPTTSSSFKTFAGVLDCGDPFASSFTNPDNIAPGQPGYATGVRNGSNKDGVQAECVPVLYTFANSILLPPYDQVRLSWDTSSQPNAAFMYTMNWRPRAVVKTNPGNVQPSPIGWPVMPRPGVAWLNTDGSNASIDGTPAFIPALACLSSQLPASYGALQGDLIATVVAGQTITVTGIAANPQSPYAVPPPGAPAIPAPPFPIVIANTVAGVQTIATERLTATSVVPGSISPDPNVVGSSYTGTYAITYVVTRNTSTEGFSAPAFHAGGTLVVSTPLPIIPNDAVTFPAPYVVQRQAQMCVADHGFTSFTIDANGDTQVLWGTTVIDIGDGYVKGSY